MTDAQHVAFCISDNYSSIVAVTLQSFVDHHTNESAFIFHIVSEALSSDNLDYLRRVIAQRSSWQLMYHPIEEKSLASKYSTLSTWSGKSLSRKMRYQA